MITRRFKTADLHAVTLNDSVLAPREKTNYTVTIPTSLQKCYETGRVEAVKLHWKEGEPNKPHFFWDSDLAKVLEGMAFELDLHPDDTTLAKELDDIIGLYEKQQGADGYINSYFLGIEPEKRWKNIYSNHELYTAGHLMEAAAAHYNATGSRRFLDIIARFADYIGTVFGPNEGQLHGYPGHEEIELGLCKLADATGDEKYLRLAEYFVNARGTEPNFFLEEAKLNGTSATPNNVNYCQAHKPVREQTEAVGHSVRALYLYIGMADVAARTGDTGLLDAAKSLYENVVNKQMYITGGVGSERYGEKFTKDYDLTNGKAYAESCANMALVQFSRRLFEATGESRYVDTMERALYNGVLSGIGLRGDEFFYANLLELDENTVADAENVAPIRQKWFGCSCCPTSFCRFIPQIASFTWANGQDGSLCLNIPAAGRYQDEAHELVVTGKYPYDGAIAIENKKAGDLTLRIRIPGWCRSWTAALNGKRVENPVMEDGYLVLARTWQAGDVVTLNLDMPIDTVRANPRVTTDAGRFALMRGPLVYALETTDNAFLLPRLSVPEKQSFALTTVPGLPEGTVAITGKGYLDADFSELYNRTPDTRQEECTFTAIPYALWCNRDNSHMLVWIRRA